MNQYCFIKLALFYQILVCPNSLKADRHAFQWPHCVINSVGLTIGVLQQMITLIIIPALGHQNKGKSSFTGSGLFVLMSQCGNTVIMSLPTTMYHVIVCFKRLIDYKQKLIEKFKQGDN